MTRTGIGAARGKYPGMNNAELIREIEDLRARIAAAYAECDVMAKLSGFETCQDVLPYRKAANRVRYALRTKPRLEVVPPTDDDPAWADVPAERAMLRTLRTGDRMYGDLKDGRSGWFDARPWVGPGGRDIYWIKRHDHPARKPTPETVGTDGRPTIGDLRRALSDERHEPRPGIESDRWSYPVSIREWLDQLGHVRSLEDIAHAPPPDDDPEWRDVPAEESPIRSLRKGDRWFLQLTQKWEIHTGSALPWTDSRWIKRHDHPARKPAVPMCSFGCGRPATETANGEPVCGDGDACIAAIPLKPAPQTEDVLGSELRVGDIIATPGYGHVVSTDDGEPTVMSGLRLTPERVYRVRLPRPAVEPSAVTKAKCPTCRCMIAPGAECACCASTSGDYPPLPSLDRDEDDRCRCYRAGGGEHIRCTRKLGHVGPCAMADVEPRQPGPRGQCARMLGAGQWCGRLPGHDGECEAPSEPTESGDGIASTRPHSPNLHLLGDARAWRVGDFNEAVTVAAAINAAHSRATRKLRERCERAERFVGVPPGDIQWCPVCGPESRCDEDGTCSACGATVGMVPDWRTLKNDRNEARECLEAANDRRKRAEADRDAAVARAEAAERVVRSLREWLHTDESLDDGPLNRALCDYDRARNDGGK